MRGRSARALAFAALGLLGLLKIAAPRPAAAALRVYDAQIAGAEVQGDKPPAVPPAPAEYLTEDRGWILFAYHPSTRDRVRPLIARVDRAREHLGALLGREALTERVEVRIAAASAELGHLAPAVDLGGATAVAFGGLRLAILSAAPRHALDPPHLEGMLHHALAHLALDEATGGAAIPRWLHEGFAVHAAGERAGLRAQTLCLATLRGRLSPLSELDGLLPVEARESSVAYAQAADFARFLLHGDSRARFAAFVEHTRGGTPPPDALARAYDGGLPELEASWRQDTARRYGFVPVLVGTLVVMTLLCAGALGVRRLRRRRIAPPISPRRRIRAEIEERASRPARSPASSVLAARGGRRRGEGEGEQDVPKVEHGGRWYTLH
jgi:hypothetical protein